MNRLVFGKNRSTTNQIAILRIVVEQTQQRNSQLIVNFLDYEKVFDSIDRAAMWKILRYHGIPQSPVSTLFSPCVVSTPVSTLCIPLCLPCVYPVSTPVYTPVYTPVSTLCIPLCLPCVYPVSTLCLPLCPPLCLPCVYPVSTLRPPCVYPASTLRLP
ncbi:uncharacterized protein LOC106012258 [Aplysia californica]|uniref:Uncharacterized protein LOC106012258 n=1 Tax=Aplysia californica TaxID=6500 RepID=A0ABM1A3I3_APLCA|nr:uncharacterized protein LOC106012258 [Aplysia californica]